MARVHNVRHVGDNTLSGVVTQPSIQILDRGFPSGDELIKYLNIRHFTTFTVVTPGGAIVPDGGKKMLRSLTVETDKHLKIIDGVDGLGLDRMLRFENTTAPNSTDCATTSSGTTASSHWRIPFADEQRLARPYDAALDMKNARMTIKRQYGPVTDIQSAGTTPSYSTREDIDVEVLPGPINTGQPTPEFAETPGWVPTREKLQMGGYGIGIPTQSSYKIPVSVGDRIMRRIYISQVTYDANGLPTEVSTIINRDAAVTLRIGREVIWDRMTWGALQDRCKLVSDVEAIPTGWAYLSFDDTKRIPDMLNLYDYPSGVAANLEIDTQNVSNAAINVYFDCLKLPPPQAVR